MDTRSPDLPSGEPAAPRGDDEKDPAVAPAGAGSIGMYRRAMLRAYADSTGLDTAVASEQFERSFESERALTARVTDSPQASPIGVETPAPGLEPFLVDALEDLLPPAARATKLKLARRRSRPRGLAVLAASLIATPVIVILALWSGGRGSSRQAEPPQRAAGSRAAGTAQPAAAEKTPQAAAPATPQQARVETPVPRVAPTLAPRAAANDEQPAPARERPAVASSESRLTVTSDPPGARVTVNGTGWGVTPVTIRHLPSGQQLIRVTKEGYVAEERVTRVAIGQPATLRMTLRARR